MEQHDPDEERREHQAQYHALVAQCADITACPDCGAPVELWAHSSDYVLYLGCTVDHRFVVGMAPCGKDAKQVYATESGLVLMQLD